MEDQEIQKVLDDLDVQLASGRIDLATYQTLSKKWNTRLANTSEAARPAVETTPSVVAVKVACPNCGAPLGDSYSPSRQSYTCEYCDHTFTVQRAEEETAKLKKELQGWLSQFVTGPAAGGTVDATSRAFIFREKLYPSLQVEFNRALEWLDGFQEFPLCEIELGSYFSAYSLASSPLVAEREQLVPIRNLSGKLSAPAVREFVVLPEDEQKLAQMEGRARELIYTSNVVEQTRRFSAEGYAIARQNIGALREICAQIQSVDPSSSKKQFQQACTVRLQGTELAFDVLSRLYQTSSGEVMGSTFSGELEGALRSYGEALTLAESSQHSPMETVPWQHGVEKEVSLIRLESVLLTCYDKAVANRGGSFFDFQSHVREFIAQSRVSVGNPDDLSSLIECLTAIVEAKRGSKGLLRIVDWGWLDSAVEENRKKSPIKFLGINEQVERIEQYLQPFWLCDLNYSQSEGTIFKSGATKHGLVLLDATSIREAIASTVEDGSTLNGQLESASRHGSPERRMVLPVLVSERAVLSILERHVRSNPTFHNPQVKLRGVVYVPAAQVTYRSKQGTRQVVVSVVNALNQDTRALRQSTLSFVKNYEA